MLPACQQEFLNHPKVSDHQSKKKLASKKITASASEQRVASDPPVIALIGCGAISEALHLPALSRHAAVMGRCICVDPNLGRATAMAKQFGAARAVALYEDVIGDLDGAIVAVPPSLHYPVAMDLLSAKVHVLCEKPLAENGAMARALVAKASEVGVGLCVNNYRRLYPSSIKVRDLIAAGELGTVRHLSYSWGERFDWPTASGAYFGVAAGGRGVLADKGSHLLDLICWWLGGKPEIVSYEDDSMGGTEAVAALRFRMSQCEGVVQLSWLSRYGNAFEVKGDRGTVAGGLFDWNTLDLIPASGSKSTLRLSSKAKIPQDLGATLLDNFLEVVSGRAAPLVSGSDVLPSIELIDECYSQRKRLAAPWYDSWQRIAG
jgi:predicted dehydrogenase